MSDFSRSDIQLIASILGQAEQELSQGIGDATSHPGALLDLETAFIRLRGSTEYHDADYAINSLHFNANDPVGLGLLEAFFSPTTSAPASFVSSSTLPGGDHWYPAYDGPPCTEGWGILQYNAWYGWRPTPLTTLSEPSGPLPNTSTPNVVGYLRINPSYTYPLHYDTISHNYSRVHLFQRARFISLQNTTGTNINTALNSFAFSIPVDQLQGCRIVDANGIPYDLRIFSDPALIQTYNSGTQIWGAIGTLNQNTLLTQSAYTVSLSEDKTTYNFIVNMPMNITWNNGSFWHFVMYWGSVDPYLDTVLSPIFVSHTNILDLTHNIICYLWPTKSFFNPTVSDMPGWNQLGDFGPTLTAVNQTHYTFYDGQYSTPTDPRYYSIPANLPGAPNFGLDNHLSGYIDLHVGSASAVRVVVTPQATQGYTVPQILFGPEIFPDFFPTSWDECSYFPPEPANTITLALLVVKKAPGYAYNLQLGESLLFNPFTEDTSLYSDLSIIWSKQVIPTYALPPIGDPILTRTCLLPLYQVLNKFRSVSFKDIISQIAYLLLVPSIGEPTSIASSLGAFSNPAGTASTIFHGLLKSPISLALKSRPSVEPLAIPFDVPGHQAIYNLSNSDPSTVLMNLKADELTLTGNTLFAPTNVELYMDNQNTCIDPDENSNSGGLSLGWDYMLRLELIDGSKNTLIKDWPIMASSFYITDAQLASRQANGQTTVGYYTSDTINSINAYRLQGYAGLVPDLKAGQSRLLTTQMVAPPDATQTTEAQFIAQKQSSGETQAQINEDILQYNEDGNTFYTVDTNHYPNSFTALNSVGVTVTQYTYDSAYWDVNVDYYFGLADSPKVSLFYPPSILTLPNGDDFILNTTAEGLSINLSSTSELYQGSVKLKIIFDATNHTGALTNVDTAYIGVTLHADNSGEPSSTILATSSTHILFSFLTSAYQEIIFSMPYTLEAATQYWLVLTPSETPTGGTIDLDGSTTVLGGLQRLTGVSWAVDNGTAWLKLYAIASPRADSFTIAQSGLSAGTVETYGNQSQTVLPTDQYTGNSGLDFSLKNQIEAIAVTPNQNWSVYEASFRIKMSNTSGHTPTGLLQFSIYTSIFDLNTSIYVPDKLLAIGGTIDFSSLTGVYEEYKISLPVQLFANNLYFIQITQSPIPESEPKVIVYLQSSEPSSFNVDGYLFFNNDISDWSADTNNSNQETGAPWMQFYAENPFVLGVFNRASSNVTQYLPPPNTVRASATYLVEGTWSYTSKRLPISAPISIYPRAINVADTWEYVRFSKDIHYIVRAIVGGEIIDCYGVCSAATSDSDPAPTEITLDIGNVDGIVYLGIGKTYDDIHNETHGAPSSDLLVLRSV